MIPPPDNRIAISLGLANLFAAMELLKEAERQDRKAHEDAKPEKIQKRGGLWWHDSEPRNPIT